MVIKMPTNIVYNEITNFCTFNIRINDNARTVTVRTTIEDAKADKDAFEQNGFTSYIINIQVIDIPSPPSCNIYSNRYDCPAFVERWGQNQLIFWVATVFKTDPEHVFFIEG